jgi:hypothetical protein
MPLLLVAYDLGKKGTDYQALLNKINGYSNIRITESAYAIITDKSPTDVCIEMQKYIGDENTIYVITLKRPYGASKWNFVNDWLHKELTY